MTETRYCWRSERHCAYYALRELELKLGENREYGTTIFRWPDPEGGYRYSFQKPVYAGTGSEWKPLGKVPWGTTEWAHCHTHPNGSYFSKQDTKWARGEGGLTGEKFTIYMVNRSGGYWYDGRTEFLAHEDRFGVLFTT